jgi:hypothetical protein
VNSRLTILASTKLVSPGSCIIPKSLLDPALRLGLWPRNKFFCIHDFWLAPVFARERGGGLTIPFPPPPSDQISHSSSTRFSARRRSKGEFISKSGERDSPRVNSCLHLIEEIAEISSHCQAETSMLREPNRCRSFACPMVASRCDSRSFFVICIVWNQSSLPSCALRKYHHEAVRLSYKATP